MTFDKDDYIKFMYNPNNSLNCTECPENSGFSGKLPCGQQNCWVDCHCQSNEDDYEDDFKDDIMMSFGELCKLVKSTEEFIVSYDSDQSGVKFYGGGLTITVKINNRDFSLDWDLFPLFEGNYTDWETVKNELILCWVTDFSDFDCKMYEKYNDIDKDTYNQVKDLMIKFFKYLANSIESISESQNIDLDQFFKD